MVGRPRQFRPWLNAGRIRASADHLVGVGVGHIETKIGNPYVSGDGDHGVPRERRHARKGRHDGEPRLGLDDVELVVI